MFTNYDHLFIIIVITTNSLPFSPHFLPFCYTSYHPDCKLQKTMVCIYLVHSAVVLQLCSIFKHCCINSNDGRDTGEKNQNWQIFLDDVFTIILYIPTTKREVLKQQLKNETVPDLFYLIIPIMIFKALAIEQPEPL